MALRSASTPVPLLLLLIPLAGAGCGGGGGGGSDGGPADQALAGPGDLAVAPTEDLARAPAEDLAKAPSILGTWTFANQAGESQTLTFSGADEAGKVQAALKNSAGDNCFDTVEGEGSFTFKPGAPKNGAPTWALGVTLATGKVAISGCKNPADDKIPRAATAKELEPYADLVAGTVTAFDGTKLTLEDKGVGLVREYKKQ